MKRGWLRAERPWMSRVGHYIMWKRHRCFVCWLIETWEISIWRSKTMSEVNATGMWQLIPGCVEGILYPHAHFPRININILAWADTLLVYLQGQFSGPQSTDEQRWNPRFSFCSLPWENSKLPLRVPEAEWCYAKDGKSCFRTLFWGGEIVQCQGFSWGVRFEHEKEILL